jgi:hypothetical protein
MNHSKKVLVLLVTLVFVATVSAAAAAKVPSPFFGALPEDQVAFEVIGQVKNSPSPGPGLPATSVQYGYLSYVAGLTDDQTYVPGGPQNETTAFFTFYNESKTLRVTPHGRFNIIVREGTMTIYHNAAPAGDLTTPNPDSFRSGVPVQVSTWRHQVIFEPTPTGLFFVTFMNTIQTSPSFDAGGRYMRIGRPGDMFRISLVGGPDPAGLVNGKFAGTAIGVKSGD